MALIKCHECGHKVSERASACPNCGCPIGRNYCTECGHEVSDKVSACPNCGCPIGKRNYCVECGQLMPEGVSVCPNCGCPTQDNRTHGFEPPKKRKSGLIWTLSILLLAILLGGGYYFFNKTNGAAGEIVKEINIDSLLVDGHYTFKGNWESSSHSAQPCKLEFEKNGKDLKKCAYTNLKFNTRIPLNGTIQNDTLHFVGDISGKQLVINLKITSDGNILVGYGIDYAHSGDKAELNLTKAEFSKLKAIEQVLPHEERKTITDNGSNDSKDRIILDDENDNYNNSTTSNNNSSNNKLAEFDRTIETTTPIMQNAYHQFLRDVRSGGYTTITPPSSFYELSNACTTIGAAAKQAQRICERNGNRDDALRYERIWEIESQLYNSADNILGNLH